MTPPVGRTSQRPLNLVANRWLPVRRRSGIRDTIRPAQILDALDDDPVIAPDWPRPDFRFATLEFLIGLLAIAYPPRDHDAWLAGWHEPPSPKELDAALAPLVHAFNLDGSGPRFLQDFDELDGDPEPVERLLIEAPGESTINKNTDLLVKRGRAARLSRAAAAMALFTLQSWAPSGGAGNRVGLRGGGPLLTLALPERRNTLWHVLWANLPCGDPAPTNALPRVLPWLAPTLTSKGARKVVPEEDAHPLQAFWGMPRRIRLDFAPNTEDAPCDLTGARDAVHVIGWRQRPHGPNYAAWGLRHPLTPYYQSTAGGEWLALHPQPGGIGYRHWLGLVLDSPDGLRKPAACVSTWRSMRRRDAREPAQTRLVAAGFDMDNMKARGFVESEMPLPGADAEQQPRIDKLAAALVQSAELAANLLRKAVRAALFSPGATVKIDAEALASVRERLWARTEAAFFASLDSTARDGTAMEGAEPERRHWLGLLRSTALALFDEVAPLAPELGAAAPRIATARRSLLIAFAGAGQKGKALFALLGLVPSAKPEPKEAA